MNQPDIVFIVLDTQRADRLGCYGYDKPLTPNLDRFAEDAVVFENPVSAAQWTIPSHASMFTGLYPTAHQLTQSHLSLGPDTPHAVELLRDMGYQTVGFCNNPLVGVLENGLKRGFDAFYNYGGTFPNRPEDDNPTVWRRMQKKYADFMRGRLAGPVQNFFGRSDSAFSVSLNAWFTPLWSKWGNFKGQNERSVDDVTKFLRKREKQSAEQPLFLFLNLMETHLPFYPPKKYVEAVAPDLYHNGTIRRVMHEWNREAYRWSKPLPDGIGKDEWDVLNAMYDAEVMYQDDYLKQLFATLDARQNKENTLVVIVGDHGDSFGEHDYFGHAFVAYQELLHVPLIMKWPRELTAGERIADPVSTRRVFHTVLSAAGDLPADTVNVNQAEVRGLSLCEVVHGRDVEQATVYAEAYPPLNFVQAIRDRQPELIEQFQLEGVRRTLVERSNKLIQIDYEPDEMFDLAVDWRELQNIAPAEAAEASRLNQNLNRIAGTVESQRDSLLAGAPIDIEQDEALMEHLRGLGYIE